MLKWFAKKEKEPVYTQSEVDKLLRNNFKDLLDIFETKLSCLPKTLTEEEIRDLVNQRNAIIDPVPYDSIYSRCMDFVESKLSDFSHDTKKQFEKRIDTLEIPNMLEISEMIQNLNNLRITNISADGEFVTAGETIACKVDLNLPAPKHGCVAIVTCDNEDVFAVNAIHFAHGVSSSSFDIKTFLVSEKKVSNLTITVNGHTQKFQITVMPPVKSNE